MRARLIEPVWLAPAHYEASHLITYLPSLEPCLVPGQVLQSAVHSLYTWYSVCLCFLPWRWWGPVLVDVVALHQAHRSPRVANFYPLESPDALLQVAPGYTDRKCAGDACAYSPPGLCTGVAGLALKSASHPVTLRFRESKSRRDHCDHLYNPGHRTSLK